MAKFNKKIFSASLVITALIMWLSYWFIVEIKSERQRSLRSIMSNHSSNSGIYLADTISYTNFLIDMMNKKISQDSKDLNSIANLLGNYQLDVNSINEVPWTYFDWINNDDKLVVNAVHGVLKQPIDVSDRDYVQMAKKRPNILHLSKPVIGKTSKRWIVVGGVGLLDNNGNYVGTNAIGFDLNTIALQLRSISRNENISFYIFDRNMNLLIDSTKTKQGPENTVAEEIIEKIAAYASKFKTAEEYNIDALGNEENFLIKKLDDLPFYMYVNYDRAAIKADFWNTVTSRLIELGVFGLLAISIAIYIYRRENNLRKKAEESFQLALSASKGKTEFLAYTGHELRSPLNVIIFGSEMMKSKIFGDMPPKYLEYAEDIYQNGNDLLHFIEDLMDVTKADAEGSFSLSYNMVNVEEVIDRVIKLNVSRASKQKIRIEKIIADNLPELWADSRRLRQILNNLISNAVKYSPENTCVRVIAHSIDGILQIVVEDEGFGMSREQIDIALSKYGTVKNDNSDKVESIGLGLPLVHQLMKAHKAKFDIESEPGKGTSVTLTFRLEEHSNAKTA